ncbi:hypothetical protein BrevBR_15975 [Brevundimonas sp. BR2-1]|uniref:hypothetical protein n=1 Tax=Brevundimonas sp. BR2-1 TaxID=3031123 RepID=UPI0030A15EE3
MFGIVTASDFRDKARRDSAALQADIANPDLAMNAVLSNFHLHEWIWTQVLKPMAPPTLRGAVFRSKADWLRWLDANCPHFQLIQALANGSKHCFVATIPNGWGATVEAHMASVRSENRICLSTSAQNSKPETVGLPEVK